MKTLELKLTLLTILFFSLISSTKAQEKSPAHIGFFYPISTHGTQAENYSNNFSLHVLTGLSGGENGLAIYGLAGLVKGNMNGAQVSGLWNNVSGDVDGVQVAGILNQSQDAAQALQVAGITNLNQGDAAVQVSGIFNAAKNVQGGQFSGITSLAADLDGIQVSGVSSIADSVKGLQTSGIINIAEEIDGGQISGITNVAENVNGMQISGISNVAEQVDGVQISALINRAKSVKGLQLGLINIADSSENTIGLINIIKNGDHRIGLSIDENYNSFLTLRSGGKRVYGIFGLGSNFELDERRYGLEAGLGLGLAESRVFRLDVEIVSKYMTDFDCHDYSKSSFQLIPSLKITNGIHLFAGPSLSYLHSYDSPLGESMGLTIWDDIWRDNYQAIMLGFTAGLNVRF
ncbi:hypothetical protein PBT90_08575 [Algoriphagus halophytocola]|uniref:hypothetical protein n=1 Tax=Algoriphagus halophytocola TaxID=2991499 RepID=UPI0022DD5C40|nr:hypothetical protein [Algoriphagus sp. TR-M9]WBL44735.1 hypothetical protein PBT90_08575 [Algoriphagus sp. TR-M9]